MVTNKIGLMHKATVLYVLYSVLHGSCFIETMPIVKAAIEMLFVTSLLLFIYIWVCYGKKNLWTYIFAAFIYVMPVYLYILGTYRTFDLYLVLAMSIGYSFDRLLRTYLKWGTIALLFVVACSMVGILPDIVSKRDDLYMTKTVLTSHAVGFVYRSGPAYISMCLLICYLYLHRHFCSNKQILIYVMLSLFAYLVCVTRLQLVVNILILIMYFLTYKFQLLKFKNIVWKWIAIVGFPFFMAMIYVLFALPEYEFIQKDETLNQIFNARFFLNQTAFANYDVNTWGHMVEVSNDENDYFYIDSGYVATLLKYGWVFSVVIMLMYSLTFYKIYRSGNSFLYVWMLIFMLFCVVNNFVISLMSFPLLSLAFTQLGMERCNVINTK